MKKIVIIFLLLSLTSCHPPKEEDDPFASPAPSDPTEPSRNLKVSAFNIQIFGDSKISKPLVVNALKQILPRYDLVLIQEIRDADGDSIQILLNELNDVTNLRYQMVIGSRVGRSTSKEQYAYFYDANKLSVLDSYEYDDGIEPNNDTFEREPYIVRWRFNTTNVEFFTVGIHTKPDDAKNEISALEQVYWDTVTRWGEHNAILMGDFNADCSYLSDSEYNALTLVTDSRFTWHINKSLDTTVGASNCAYDHFVTTNFLSSTVSGASIYNFTQTLGLSQTDAEDVSDHFPIEIDFQF